MQSVAIGSGITLELATKFYTWLRAPLEASVSESGPATGKGGNPDSEADTTESGGAVQPRAVPSDSSRKLGWDNRYPEER